MLIEVVCECFIDWYDDFDVWQKIVWFVLVW